jgi:hypothetical protein
MEGNILAPGGRARIKKKRKSRKDFKTEKKRLHGYTKKVESEFSKAFNEIENLETKKRFYTPEANFEMIDIPDYRASGKTKKKNKNIIFDIQIKNADEYVYEKIIID